MQNSAIAQAPSAPYLTTLNPQQRAAVEATEGALLLPDHVFIIPPGHYLSVVDGALHLSRPPPRQGTRLPFD